MAKVRVRKPRPLHICGFKFMTCGSGVFIFGCLITLESAKKTRDWLTRAIEWLEAQSRK